MNLLAFDTETSIINSGDPYHPDNRLVEVGFYNGTEYRIQYKDDINTMTIKDTVQYNILVGANLKFELIVFLYFSDNRLRDILFLLLEDQM